MHIEVNALSDTGLRRPGNEDSFLIDRELGLFVVCDGMGGHAAGEVASTRAAQLTSEIMRQHRHTIQQVTELPGGHFKVVQIVTDCVRVVCQSIHQMAAENPQYAGMGTTLTMLLVVGEKAVLAHVGDSRMYLLRSGSLHQMTNDHTLSNELIQTGRIAAGSPDAGRFSHVLTRCVGNQEFVDVETLLFDLLPNDRLLLCSDGLSNYFLDKSEVVGILSDSDLASIPVQLIDLANKRGGNDNITSLVLQVSQGSAETAAETHSKLDALKRSFLCKGLSLSRRMRVANIGEVRNFGPEEWIVHEEEYPNGMFVMLSGSCTSTSPSGVKKELKAGDSFGETWIAGGDRYQYRIRVRSDDSASVLFVPRDAFHSLARRVPKLGRRLTENLLRHICDLYDQLLTDSDSSEEFCHRMIEEQEPI